MVFCTHSSPSALEQHVNYSSMYQYIPAHTSTYWHILVCICMYRYILVHTSTYWYEALRTSRPNGVLVGIRVLYIWALQEEIVKRISLQAKS
jgi:hypothetical protein